MSDNMTIKGLINFMRGEQQRYTQVGPAGMSTVFMEWADWLEEHRKEHDCLLAIKKLAGEIVVGGHLFYNEYLDKGRMVEETSCIYCSKVYSGNLTSDNCMNPECPAFQLCELLEK